MQTGGCNSTVQRREVTTLPVEREGSICTGGRGRGQYASWGEEGVNTLPRGEEGVNTFTGAMGRVVCSVQGLEEGFRAVYMGEGKDCVQWTGVRGKISYSVQR